MENFINNAPFIVVLLCLIVRLLAVQFVRKAMTS